MKNQTRQAWIWQGLMAITLFATIGINTAHAASPFQADDFVTIASDLVVQKNEITYAQYSALKAQLPVANQTPWEADDCFLKDHIAKGFGPNYAAACISYDDAEAYIRVLNAQDPNYTYRLPTRSEFKTLVSITFIGLRISDGQLSRHAWYFPGSNDHAHEVCTKKPTIYGLCDILGNVWEWTSTRVGSGYVARGGAWSYGASFLRFDYRNFDGPGYRNVDVGFRLVRTAK